MTMEHTTWKQVRTWAYMHSSFPFVHSWLLRLWSGLTVCVSGGGAGVDSAWEQGKLEARKMLENRAESPPSTARFVSPLLIWKTDFL